VHLLILGSFANMILTLDNPDARSVQTTASVVAAWEPRSGESRDADLKWIGRHAQLDNHPKEST
jgi:hypothetical protein